jgi:23S rRNA (adenine2030-N6)-methyltransferase
MNYRHAYHAGNFADVLKHIVMALCIDHLKAKDKPFMVLDAHAGVGLYDLTSVPSGKTGEWEAGIGRLWGRDLPPSAESYMRALHALNPDGALRYYPGSPVLAAELARGFDRLIFNEKHPEDFQTLSLRFRSDERVKVTDGDAYGALKAHLPPPERRGLVLIDPPYEEKDECARLTKGLGQALSRWPTGTYMVWYPIKGRAQVDRMLADVVNLAPPPTLVAEVMIHGDDDPNRLNGSGVMVINPPWMLETHLAEILPPITNLMAHNGGHWRSHWLVAEK